MEINWAVIAQIASPIIGFFLGVAAQIYRENKPKLIAHYGHVSGFRSQWEDGTPHEVNTHSVVIKSMKSVKNVRVTHNYLPDFSIHPDIEYTVRDLPVGGIGSDLLIDI